MTEPQTSPINHNVPYCGTNQTLAEIVSLLQMDQAIILVAGSLRQDLSTLLLNLENELKYSNFVLIINPPNKTQSIIQQLATQLYLPDTLSTRSQLPVLIEHALSAANNRRVVLLCSNVDLLDAADMEQLRQLSNLYSTTHNAISLVLLSGKTLLRTSRQPGFQAFQQRITSQFTLPSPIYSLSHLYKHLWQLGWGITALIIGVMIWSQLSNPIKNQSAARPSSPPKNILSEIKPSPIVLSSLLTQTPHQQTEQPEAFAHVFETVEGALQAIKGATLSPTITPPLPESPQTGKI